MNPSHRTCSSIHRYLPCLSGVGQANLSIPSIARGHSGRRKKETNYSTQSLSFHIVSFSLPSAVIKSTSGGRGTFDISRSQRSVYMTDFRVLLPLNCFRKTKDFSFRFGQVRSGMKFFFLIYIIYTVRTVHTKDFLYQKTYKRDWVYGGGFNITRWHFKICSKITKKIH